MPDDPHALPRQHALQAWRAGLVAVDGAAATARALAKRVDFRTSDSDVLVVATGKAAAAMMRGALPVARGIILLPRDADAGELPPSVRVLHGGHPEPTLEGMAATRVILDEAARLQSHQTLLFLLSGGTSALLEAAADGVDASDLIEMHRLLVGSGAAIDDINCVRTCLSAVKGGGLAAAAHPARVITLAISDVPGDDAAVIGSGPTVARAADFERAAKIVGRLGLRLPRSVQRRLAANASRPLASTMEIDRDRYEIVACAADASRAASAHLQACGYRVETISLDGTTEDAAARVMTRIEALAAGDRSAALVAAGETVVRTARQSTGRGGRNLDLAARLALAIASGAGPVACAPRSVCIVSAGTDGRDGSSSAAGAIVDAGTAARAAAAGFPLRDALAAFDTEPALRAAGDVLVTGPTGTNVGDLLVAIVVPGPSRCAPGAGSC